MTDNDRAAKRDDLNERLGGNTPGIHCTREEWDAYERQAANILHGTYPEFAPLTWHLERLLEDVFGVPDEVAALDGVHVPAIDAALER